MIVLALASVRTASSLSFVLNTTHVLSVNNFIIYCDTLVSFWRHIGKTMPTSKFLCVLKLSEMQWFVDEMWQWRQDGNELVSGNDGGNTTSKPQ